jgi:hypothetical protein
MGVALLKLGLSSLTVFEECVQARHAEYRFVLDTRR